ncbi:MAG: recombinase family protein [Oscillospiraceae bacterium]|nr:recombinase family protein [Oscillospiraceae bacterium]
MRSIFVSNKSSLLPAPCAEIDKTFQQSYNTAAYTRASKDDTDSSSIENQIELIRDYVKGVPEIRVVSERKDNGFSGATFFRPDFVKMMQDIEAGKINCVIVKDLSRLGRNYIEVGELMEVIFPRWGVRLIAINDHYDSLNPRSDSDDIIIPFKNLINEQYLRDFSIKIRSNLTVKRKNGEFVAPFAPYGYKRDETDKHRLAVDEHAAGVVQNIFRWKIEGQSQQRIADRLNEIGEPSPAEYKKRDTNYRAQFQKHVRASWSAVAASRILRNPVYIGTLIQGKETTPNYKVKKRVVKPEDEWHISEDSHEPIISKSDFEIVNGLLSQDTRTAPGKDAVYPFSGMMFCADCGNNMVRTKSDKHCYYVCATSRAKNVEKKCTSHCKRQDELERDVMDAVKNQIAYVLDIEASLEFIRSLPYQKRNIAMLNSQIADRQKEIKSCEKYKRSLYEDYKSGIISKDDHTQFGSDYTERIEELRQAVERLAQETELLLNNTGSHKWIEEFKRFRMITELSRELAVSLIERIDIYDGKRISIRFRYNDKIKTAQEILNNFNFEEAGCM